MSFPRSSQMATRSGLDNWSLRKRPRYVQNGIPDKGLRIFLKMVNSGLVEEGRKHFKSMKIEYSIVPGVEPYACTVYLLRRAGQLLEAYEFIENMPIEPDANVSGAMLDACRIHGNLE
ncbi:hypothetical protein BC332_18557 [Capsicum chinense]|nr:hypothetical protein BC332_18557 [Capsicum chinense]